jgi:hypothetical protein
MDAAATHDKHHDWEHGYHDPGNKQAVISQVAVGFFEPFLFILLFVECPDHHHS